VLLGARHARAYKKILDDAFRTRQFGIIESRIIEYTSPMPVLCSGAFYPYWDIEGHTLQEFSPRSLSEPLGLTILNENGRGFGVMSWLRAHSAAPTLFADSLVRSDNTADALCRVAFSCLENVFCDPLWWDQLTLDQRDDLIARTLDGSNVVEGVPADFLASTAPPTMSPGEPRIYSA
jgi:hypothetical protein